MLGQEKQGRNYGIRLLCNICIHSYKVSSKHLQSCEIWGCRGHSCSARWFACSGANLYAPGWESLVLTSRFKSSRCWKKKLWYVFCWFGWGAVGFCCGVLFLLFLLLFVPVGIAPIQTWHVLLQTCARHAWFFSLQAFCSWWKGCWTEPNLAHSWE